MGHAFTQALDNSKTAMNIGVREQHDEFLSAQTGEDIRRSQFVLPCGHHVDQKGVAGRVAMAVVVDLEMVDIK
jgi:hypothetical protein